MSGRNAWVMPAVMQRSSPVRLFQRTATDRLLIRQVSEKSAARLLHFPSAAEALARVAEHQHSGNSPYTPSLIDCATAKETASFSDKQRVYQSNIPTQNSHSTHFVGSFVLATSDC